MQPEERSFEGHILGRGLYLGPRMAPKCLIFTSRLYLHFCAFIVCFRVKIVGILSIIGSDFLKVYNWYLGYLIVLYTVQYHYTWI